MSGRISTICGLFVSFGSVRKCVEALKAVNIRPGDVSVLLADGSIVSAAPLNREAAKPELVGLNGDHSREKRGSLPSGSYVERMRSSSLTRTLLTLAIPVYDSERLQERIQNGGILVLVRCSDVAAFEKIKDVLIGTGAQDISFGRRPEIELQRVPPRKDGYTAPASPELHRAAHA
ncbi:MAG TPA: hypothetical protein VGR93_09290 [Candidatus Acidoferrales bacterium]|nr:hypothetical protein [Candidatus Acidoferrales bacterium]